MKKENVDLSLKDHNERVVLHWLIQVGDWKPGDKERFKKFFKFVLGSDSCSSGALTIGKNPDELIEL
jgi:hypothetical protein